MKYLFLLITLLSCSFSFAQTATEYFENGRSKQEENDFEGALKNYSNAIEMDSTFAEALYGRASLFYDNDRYKEAVTDLTKAIALQPGPIELYMETLKLRGKTLLKMDHKEKACNDFIKARELGASVDEHDLQLCQYKEKKEERIFVKLPDRERWKISSESYEKKQHITVLVKTYDTLKKPSEYLSLISILDKKNVDVTEAMNDSYKIAKGKSKDVEFTLIEKDLKAKNPWIMYSIQNVTDEDCHCKVSQIWYFIQGDHFFHSCLMSVRNDSFTKEKKEEIIKIFKTAKIVYK